MIFYAQASGEIDRDGREIGHGYSGNGEGLDNPAMEAVADVGPIPRGLWRVGPPRTVPRLGPLAMELTVIRFDDPAVTRSGFFIHGDNAAEDHTASCGCIVADLPYREQIAAAVAAGDDTLTVTA